MGRGLVLRILRGGGGRGGLGGGTLVEEGGLGGLGRKMLVRGVLERDVKVRRRGRRRHWGRRRRRGGGNIGDAIAILFLPIEGNRAIFKMSIIAKPMSTEI